MIKLYCLTVAVMLSLGCEESRPAVPFASAQKDSPAGQFDYVMLRLKRAVLDFLPSRRAGLHVGKREVSYELFPPDATRSHYTARVTIESETVYVHNQPFQRVDKEKERQEKLERSKAQRKIEQQSEFDDPLGESYNDPLAEKFLEQMEEIGAGPRVPLVPEATIDNPQTSDRKTYDLAYLGGRWQLQTEPETDHERLWFDYALGIDPQDNSH